MILVVMGCICRALGWSRRFPLGRTKLFGTWRDDAGTVSGNTNGWIMEIDPAAGTNVSQIGVHAPPGGSPVGNGDEFGGLLGLAQNPQTGVVYGLRKTGDPYARELRSEERRVGKEGRSRWSPYH